jgi:hypothetical protein
MFPTIAIIFPTYGNNMTPNYLGNDIGIRALQARLATSNILQIFPNLGFTLKTKPTTI